ncbi:MAG: YicC/YloC family endoribonuclease [bacterium]
MIKSMTGFSRFIWDNEQYIITVEIKSLNHRYLEIIPKIPRQINPLELSLKKHVRDSLKRGRIELFINMENKENRAEEPQLNLDLAKQYYECLQSLIDNCKINGPIELSHLIAFNQIFQRQSNSDQEDIDLEKIQPYLISALDGALKNLIRMREEEGKNLYNDIIERIHTIESYIESFQNRIPEVITQHKIMLQERAKELFEQTIEPERLEQEIVIYAGKLDITEEIIRIGSHLEKLKNMLNSNDNEAAGRKMDFLIQEIYREINTTGVKALDAQISQNVVEIKSELEKIREQVQNIE